MLRKTLAAVIVLASSTPALAETTPVELAQSYWRGEQSAVIFGIGAVYGVFSALSYNDDWCGPKAFDATLATDDVMARVLQDGRRMHQNGIASGMAVTAVATAMYSCNARANAR